MDSYYDELLDGFEKRMKFMNIVRFLSITNNCPPDIRENFPGSDGLDVLNNLLMMTVLYIKDRTLSEVKSCTLSNISEFLVNVLSLIPEQYRNIDTDRLAAFFVTDILQNKGQLLDYLSYDSTKKDFDRKYLRLISEEKGSFHLTDDVFDFLYRSKEIESELDYSVNRFMMQEYMKRKNYSKAMGESRELVQKIRNMKQSMEDFLIRCKENIGRISLDEYQKIILRFRGLMSDEDDALRKIMLSAKREKEDLQRALDSGIDTEDSRKNLKSLIEIGKNIGIAIKEQRGLMNQKSRMSDSYDEILKDSFAVSSFERLNFEKDIMIPLRRANGTQLSNAMEFLFWPLSKPVFKKLSTIENFYEEMDRISDEEKPEGVELSPTENMEDEEIKRRNKIYSEIAKSFFGFAESRTTFTISEYIDSLTIEKLKSWSFEKILPDTLLSLIQMKKVDIEGFMNDQNMIIADPEGEFSLPWMLSEVLEDRKLYIKNITFQNIHKTFSYSFDNEESEIEVRMSDFLVDVTN